MKERSIMEKIFCSLTKPETIRIVDHLEAMYSIFWSESPAHTAKAIQDFLNAKNLINSILLKATSRVSEDEAPEGGFDEK